MPSYTPPVQHGPTPADQFVLPRGLILVSSLWLVVSWSVAIGFRTPVVASSASYTPGVRLMLISAAVGLVIAWPLLRLSQGPVRYPIRQTVLDLIVLLALLQVVIWPLRLVTPWSPFRTAALDATLTAWALLAGAFVASAVGSPRQGPRNMAMAGCVALCIAGPVMALASLALPPLENLAPRLAQIGPILEVYGLAQGGGTAPDPSSWRWILLVSLAAVGAWSGLAALGLLRAGRQAQMQS